MSAHTPGPWIVSHDPDAYSDDDYCIGPPDGKVDQIAVCSKRDAALIAAAPDMYEALKAVAANIDRAELNLRPTEDDVAALRAQVRAALAKASDQ